MRHQLARALLRAFAAMLELGARGGCREAGKIHPRPVRFGKRNGPFCLPAFRWVLAAGTFPGDLARRRCAESSDGRMML